MKMKKSILVSCILLCLSSFAITPHDGRTATEKWAYAAAANAADAVRSEIPEAVTNGVTSIVTKAYVEELGIEASGGKPNIIHVRASNNSIVETYDKVVEMFNQTNTIYVQYFSDANNYLLFKQDSYNKNTQEYEGTSLTVYVATFTLLANAHNSATTSLQGLSSIQIMAVPEMESIAATVKSKSLLTNNLTALQNSQVSNLIEQVAKPIAEKETEEVRQIVYTWENFLDGSNVVFSITNYISGSYSVNSPKLRIKELRDGTNYVEVYNSAEEIKVHINSFSNDYVDAKFDLFEEAFGEALSNKADKNWGKYTSEGTEIASIGYSNTVYLTAPQTVFAGGLEYERVAVGLGSVCVLTEKGAPVYTAGDEGTFKFQSDGGTNFFGFSKTDSYTLGCKTDGISVVGNLVTLQYEVIMTGCPCVWYKADLQTATPWEQLNLPDGTAVPGASHVVSWNSGSATPRECYINCPEAKGFFKATVEVAGSSRFITNMPAELGAGIICTNTSASATVKNGVIKPTYNGSQVIWTWSEL